MKNMLFIICVGVLLSTTGCIVVHGRHRDVVVVPVPPPPVVVYPR